MSEKTALEEQVIEKPDEGWKYDKEIHQWVFKEQEMAISGHALAELKLDHPSEIDGQFPRLLLKVWYQRLGAVN